MEKDLKKSENPIGILKVTQEEPVKNTA